MKTNVILLACLDREYVDKVEASIVFALNEFSKLTVIDSEEYLKEYVESMHAEVDVLIADEAIYQELHRVQPATKSFKIVEGKGVDNSISKYDGEMGILSCIGSQFLNSIIPEEEKTHIVDVVATSGGSCKTMTALGIAVHLADMGKKVLYMDAEVIQNFYEFMPEGVREDFGDENMALGFIKNPREVKATILAAIKKSSFDYFPEFREPIFAYNVSLESYYNVARYVAELGIYDYIVVEHSPELSMTMVRHLSASRMLVICTDSSAYARGRIDRFMKNIVDFNGQCFLVCDKRRGHVDSRLLGDSIVYKYPVCDSISESKANMTINDFLGEGLFKAAAEAVR